MADYDFLAIERMCTQCSISMLISHLIFELHIGVKSVKAVYVDKILGKNMVRKMLVVAVCQYLNKARNYKLYGTHLILGDPFISSLFMWNTCNSV